MNYTTWTVLEYEQGREIPVGRAMTRMGLIYYLPMETRQKRISRHSKHRETYEVPLIPGIVFVRGQDTWLSAVRAQYTEDSPVSDRFGEPWRIPEPQMLAFQSAVAEWNDLIIKRTKANQAAPTVKQEWVKFGPDALRVIEAKMAVIDEARAA